MPDVLNTSPAVKNQVRPPAREDGPFSIELELVIHDPDVIRALAERPEGEERNQFALEALKIGVLALRHVGGQATADLVQREVRNMQRALEQHNQAVHSQLSATLKHYFDPHDGRFSERVRGLVQPDGELAQLIRGHIDGENSQLVRTLMNHVGANSPLMKQLDPQQSEGLLCVIRQIVDGQLAAHGKRVIDEFSLDNEGGALARLVRELTLKHGDLTKTLGERINDVVKEFSLDKPDSALSRLVQNVDRAQRTITNEFSLDSDTSCLSRLKRELMTILEAHVKTNSEFQEEVKVALRELSVRREEAARSTRHGLAFEDAVCEFLTREAQHAGDIATSTGPTVGLIKNCKAGDCVIELGPDSPAPGAQIVVEAKEVANYQLSHAREEIETARKNRGAQWGVFVFSRQTAPPGLEPFKLYGRDFVVVWDAQDVSSDVFLKAGVAAARALCIRAGRRSIEQQVDFDAIDKAILEIERRAENLDDVRKSAETIQSSSNKILERVRIDREALEKQVTLLKDKAAVLRELAQKQ